MNTFSSKYDTKYVSEPSILTLTETELDNFINFNKNRKIPNRDYIALQIKNNNTERDDWDSILKQVQSSIDKWDSIKIEIQTLNLTLNSSMDYYLERYYNLMNKEYDVPFALSGAFENSHNIDKICSNLLLFIENQSVIDKIKAYQNSELKSQIENLYYEVYNLYHFKYNYKIELDSVIEEALNNYENKEQFPADIKSIISEKIIKELQSQIDNATLKI